MFRHVCSLPFGALLVAVALSGASAAEGEGQPIKLFNGKDLSGWRIFLNPDAKDANPNAVFRVEDGVIKCSGNPTGYIITDKEYQNYVLRLQWRWPEKGGNSGVFVHVVGPDTIWPKGVEAQLMSKHAGDFWLVGGAQLTIDPKRQDKGTPRHYYRMKTDQEVERPEGEWNQYVITCKGDTIDLVINGQLVNRGTNSELTKGKILLQSEGAPIEFRDILLVPLD
jgi:hypothetical protein